MTKAVKDLAGFENETNENLEAFQRGHAQVLFAPEAAQVGLNLQCARILVLYSVPWRPEEVDQWIGRLDRNRQCSCLCIGRRGQNHRHLHNCAKGVGRRESRDRAAAVPCV